MDTSGNIQLGDPGTSPTLGVIVEGAKTDNPVTIQMDGIGKVIVAAAGTISPGAWVESDNLGLAIVGAESDADGVALSGGNAGEVITVRLRT
jgi:flagella basal body P-ring formation protein FlgA